MSVAAKATRKAFTFVDLFAGIGGFHLAFSSIGGRCVDAVERDRFAVETYNANHEVVGGPITSRDITMIDPGSIADHDVLLAGFPCQPFSLAGVSKKNALGRRHGFEDETQGTLFFDLQRIISAKRPSVFVLENVRNLESHDKGKTFKIIKDKLSELDYRVHFKVIDSRPWVPQMRKRILIVGFDERVKLDPKFSFDRFSSRFVPDSSPRLGAILHRHDRSEKSELPYTRGVRARVDDRYVLSEHLWQYLQDYKAKHESLGNGFGYGLVGRRDIARTLSARYHKDGAEILVRRGGGVTPRRLTPRECARLMGFPDSFEIPVSDTQAYRQFGNSVVVPMVTSLAEALKTDIVRFSRETRAIGSQG